MKHAAEESVSPEVDEQEWVEPREDGAFLYAATSQTPWWIVSVLFHGLIITLAGLMSMAIDISDDGQAVIVSTPLIQPKEIAVSLPEKPKDAAVRVLATKYDVPPTDSNSTETMEVFVPPEMLELAKLDDHFETANPDLPDLHSARGVEDSHIFYSRAGVVDDPGGSPGDGHLEELIGIACNAAGFKGGHGTGIGLDDGPGAGSWGSRIGSGREWKVKRFNHGSTAPVNSVDLSLAWLAYHQEPDGHWDAKKYSAEVKTDTACTGLALLAFLGSGHTEKVGGYRDNVRRAVAWLKNKQDAGGMIWDSTDDGAHHRAKGYPCAIATLSLVEAAAMAPGIADTRAAAQKAIDYCTEKHQSGEGYDRGGWRYSPKEPGDLSVTGWFVMALKSAKVGGLHVNPQALDGAIKFLDSVEKKDAAGSGDYGPVSHYWYMPENEHGHTAHRLGAIGNLVRQFLGWKREDLQSSVEWFVNKGGVPSWGANGETVDLYYWYYGSMCVFQQGGDVWERWNKGMLSALLSNQCKQGDERGSWNPTGEYCTEWGRVGQTALSALCLEVYWRYKQVYGGQAF